MFRPFLFVVLSSICASAAVFAGPVVSASPSGKNPARFMEFTDAEQTKLRAGETVVWSHCLRDTKKISVLSAILLPFSPQDAWALLDDKEGACEYISDLERCKVLEKKGNQELVEQTTRPEGAPRSFTYTLRHEATFPTRMDFSRESGDLRDIQGSWLFDPVDGGAQTLLIYALHIDAGMLVPQRMIRRSQEKELPEVLVAIRDRLASQKESGLCCGAVEIPVTPVSGTVVPTPVVATPVVTSPVVTSPVVATPIAMP